MDLLEISRVHTFRNSETFVRDETIEPGTDQEDGKLRKDLECKNFFLSTTYYLVRKLLGSLIVQILFHINKVEKKSYISMSATRLL